MLGKRSARFSTSGKDSRLTETQSACVTLFADIAPSTLAISAARSGKLIWQCESTNTPEASETTIAAAKASLAWETGQNIFHGQTFVEGVFCHTPIAHDRVIPLHKLIYGHAARQFPQ